VWRERYDQLRVARLLARCVLSQPLATPLLGNALLAYLAATIDCATQHAVASHDGARFVAALLHALPSCASTTTVRDGVVAALLATFELAPTTLAVARQPLATLLPLHASLPSRLAAQLLATVERYLQRGARLSSNEMLGYCALFVDLVDQPAFFAFVDTFQRHVASGRLDTIALRAANLLPILFSLLDQTRQSLHKGMSNGFGC
jgi:hypothetical protein